MNKATISTLVMSVLSVLPLSAAINFGSRRAAIETTAGSFAFNNDAISMRKGTLCTRGAGSFSNTAGDYLDCSKMTFLTEVSDAQKGMGVDGKLYLADGALTLESNDVLEVNGGQIAETVTVDGAASTPSVIRGNGSFASTITINATRELLIDWQGELNQNIALASTTATTTLTLGDDLRFINGYGLTTSAGGAALIDFDEHEMTIGEVTIGPNAQTWKNARLNLTGDTTISADVTLTASPIQVNGNGHKLTLSGGFLGTVGGTISDVYFPNYDSGYLGGTGHWNIRNTIFDDGSQKVRIVDGVLHDAVTNLFEGNATWNGATTVELLSPLTLKGHWRFYSDSYISGNGHNIMFEGSNGALEYDSNLYLSDLSLSRVARGSFDEGTFLYLSNVVWRDDKLGRAIRISAPPYADNQWTRLTFPSAGYTTQSDIFDARYFIHWHGPSYIELLSNIDLKAEWLFVNGSSTIQGNGYTLDLSGDALIDFDSADMHFADITLVGIESNSFDCGGNSYELHLSNVTWIDSSGQALHVFGSGDLSDSAQLQLPISTTAGSIFSQAVTWENGFDMELHSGIQFGTSGAWTLSEDSTLRGNGHVIDVSSALGPIIVAANKTLTITDAVLLGWSDNVISLGAGAGLELSNVTIVMDDHYMPDLTDKTLKFKGGCTLVTGGYSFKPTGMTLEIHGSLLYDSLGREDSTFVYLGDGPFTGGGQVMMKPLGSTQDITFDSNANYVVNSSILSYDIINGSDTYLGRTLTFDNSTAFALQGGGRSLVMTRQPSTSASSAKLITVTGSASNKVELEDITLDGWDPANIDDANNLIHYGNGAVIRLKDDIALTNLVNISNLSSGDTVTFDLNGHQLDLDSDSSGFDIAATNVNFIIKNGRIMNLNDNGSGTKFLLNSGTTSTVIFQDCDLVLNGPARMLNNNVIFKGRCKITGTTDATLSLYGTDVTIAAGAWLTIDKNMTLEMHENNSTITFGSANATLELFGATLDTSNVYPFSLKAGTLRIDDLATLNGSMTLGGSGTSELNIDLQPAASLKVASGTITYANDS